MNVFRSETSTNEAIENIKNDIITSEINDNDDMNITLKGYMHNQTGFVLNVTNIEKIDDSVLTNWKQKVQNRGYQCDLRYDFHDGWVDIRCTQSPKRKSILKARQLQQLGYLSVMVVSIYMLWQKHNPHLE
jgi:hypothetical protein